MSGIYNRQWYELVKGQVYLSTGAGHVTTEILNEFDQEFCAILDASSHPLVHLIHDARYILSLPSLNDVRKAKYPLHPRMGYNVSVGALQHPLMRFIVGMASAIVGARSKDVTTLKEAYTYLLERDPTLPPLEDWTFPPETNFAAS